MIRQPVESPSARRTITIATRLLLALQLDGPLLVGLALIASYGLIVLYSASGQDGGKVLRAVVHLALGTAAMLGLAQAKPQALRRAAPWLYGVGVLLLLVVFAEGVIGKGARRWLDLGFIRFQPSEILKIAVPMFCAWYLQDRPLPPTPRSLAAIAAIILVPAALIIKQPDLGTALLIVAGGAMVVIMAGLPAWIMLATAVAGS
ncbi:MAG: rod shape determining protein RodA, partial [Pseudomonadota bacterium]